MNTVREAIRAHIVATFSDIESPKRLEQMTDDLTDFVLLAVEKFYNGYLEHGGDLADIDCEQELKKELVDLFWYNAARKW